MRQLKNGASLEKWKISIEMRELEKFIRMFVRKYKYHVNNQSISDMNDILFHYTSMGSLCNIVRDGQLTFWAFHIHSMEDGLEYRSSE